MTTRRNQTEHKRPQPQAPSASGALSDHIFESPELLTRALTHRSLAYETDPEGAQRSQRGQRTTGVHRRCGAGAGGGGGAAAQLSRLARGRVDPAAGVAGQPWTSRQGWPRVSIWARRYALGRGEEHSGGRHKEAILANALEAVIAAIYLDGGLQPAKDFIERHIVEPALPDLRLAIRSGDTFSGAIGDYKSALQEHLQAIGAGQPEYVLTAQTGPDHQKRFRVEVRVSDGAGGFAGAGRVGGLDQEAGSAGGGRMACAELLAEKQAAEEQEAKQVEP